MVKDLPANAGNIRDVGSIPGSGRSPGGGYGNPLQHSYLENPNRQRSLAGYSPWGDKESDTTEWLTLSFSPWYKAHEGRYFSLLFSAISPVHRPMPETHRVLHIFVQWTKWIHVCSFSYSQYPSWYHDMCSGPALQFTGLSEKWKCESLCSEFQDDNRRTLEQWGSSKCGALCDCVGHMSMKLALYVIPRCLWLMPFL